MSCGDKFLQKCLVSQCGMPGDSQRTSGGSPLNDTAMSAGKHLRRGAQIQMLSGIASPAFSTWQQSLHVWRKCRSVAQGTAVVGGDRWDCGSCMQWGVCQGTRDKATITHNEGSRAHADTNAVRGETRDRALVTTVRGRHSSDRRHYGYQIEQMLHWWYLKLTINNVEIKQIDN